MKSRFWKNSFKSIKSNISRFLAMLSIILLSSGVITGLLVSAPNMQMSMSEEFTKYNTADIQVISDIGFNDKSISYIEDIDDDFIVQGVSIFDKQVELNNERELSSLVYSLELSNMKINKFELLEGTMPKNDNEILAQRSSYYIEHINLGDIVKIDNKDYTVSGIVANTWYFTKEAERSVTTSNKVKGIFYKNSDPNIDEYTNIFVTTLKNKGLNQFSKSYTKLISQKSLLIEAISKIIIKQRLLDIGMSDTLSVNEVDLYVLNRSSNLSYQTYKTFVNKVSTITQIFPIFFLIISILVVLTTMTRMIEEERQEIGVLRSLGYSKRIIYLKYLIYALIVGLIGASVGYATGFRLIPSIINSAFLSVFYLPGLNLDIFSLSNILYLIFIVVSILITTVFAIRKTLKQNVAAMLVAKSPKYGKRILLEKIPFFWNRLKFKYKSSLRNLFRYPNHFIMTVIGIAGSLSLVFTGLALTNSISAITKIQYQEITKYDVSVDINGLDNDFNEYITSNFDDFIYVYESSYMVTTKKGNENIYVNVIVTDDDINDFISLRTRNKKQELTLNNEGVIITEQLANYMKLKVNDIFNANKTHDLKITGISENYIDNYVFMTKVYYENNFETLGDFNKVLIKGNITDEVEVSEKLLEFSNVLNTSFLTEEIIAKDRLLSQVSILAIVIVLAACFLAIVIIYNLTNVNISERQKELSTLKVLGYKNTEVSNYIFREINIMTFIAIILGTPLGYLLNKYVILSIEEPNMMMGRSVKWYTFIISIALIIVVTLFVEFIMSFKIKNIDMIGALREL